MVRPNACLLWGMVLALSTAAGARAAVFNLSSTLDGGATLSGTVTINTATGIVTATNLTATIPTTFTLTSASVTTNYANTGLSVIQASNSSGNPVAVIGEAVPSFAGFTGGPISSSSGVFDASTRYGLLSGEMTFAGTQPLTQPLGHVGGIYNVTGTLDHGSLGGSVLIDMIDGSIIASNITATIPITYKLTANLSTTPNYSGTGLDVFQASTTDGTVVAVMGAPVASFVNYNGGSIASVSGLFMNSTRYALISGQLTPVPEPTALAMAGAAGLVALTKRRRSRRGADVNIVR